jgi:hypothetical protein
MGRARAFAFLLVATGAMALVLSCQESTTITGGSRPQTATFTEAWQGMWQLDSVVRACNGDSLDTAANILNVCQGDTIQLDVGLGFTIRCVGTVTDTSFTVTCNDIVDDAGCRRDVKARWTMVREADTARGTVDVDATITGASCEFNGTFCLRFEQEATRIGGGACSTAPR